MITLTLSDILEATGGSHLGGERQRFEGVSIDSRTVRENELFVAIKGLRYDGHDFLPDALSHAAGAIVSIPPGEPVPGRTVVCVPNTLRALQDLAHFLREKKPGIPIVGITGTNGKTTTKEMAASVLGVRWCVLKSGGNLNNQIGLPLSLLALNGIHEAAVLEMGASRPGDIEELCRIASPNIGVITNIGMAHLEGFGSLESLRSTKLEILSGVETAIVNSDDDFLMEGLGDYRGRLVRYGLKSEGEPDVTAVDMDFENGNSLFVLRLPESGEAEVRLRAGGHFNVHNALAAAAVGYATGLSLGDIVRGLEEFEGVHLRFSVVHHGDMVILSDVYNANPSSMEEAIKELVRLKKGGRAIAVLGDMLELGAYEETAHRSLGRLLTNLGVDLLVAVGPRMKYAVEEFTGRSLLVADSARARAILEKELRSGDTVLLKGSRSMCMEEASPYAI